MNEITKIHLGRQAFTIAVDAYKALQDYLHAIRRHVGGKDDVVEEVELRMAELLLERGVTGDKVVLRQDVEYLQQQLGEPRDFGDEEAEKPADDTATSKRLFRDTEHGMLAGVCAGIAKYLGVDPVWVRLAFVAMVLLGASGILLYIVLWIVVPEAKTTSERLQMQGKSVTVEALKEVVDRADVKGAAERAQRTAGKAVNTVLKVFLAVVGIALMIGGITALLGLTTGSVYLALNHDVLLPFGIFPVGVGETVLAGLIPLAAAMPALFLIFAGLSMVKRKWSLAGWGLGAIVAIFLASLAVGTALAGGAAPKVADRFKAVHHSEDRPVSPFTDVTVMGDQYAPDRTEVERRVADQYRVEIRYLGKADTSGVTVKEVGKGLLEIDTSKFKPDPKCAASPCVFANRPQQQIILYAPAQQHIEITGNWFALYEPFR